MKKNELNQEIQARTPSTCGSRRPSLTPAMGFFNRQGVRRPSEISIDTQKSNLLATSYPKFQFNNFAWRPGSSPGLESALTNNDSFNDLKRTHSFRNSSGHLNSLTNLKIPSEKCKLDELKSYRKMNSNSDRGAKSNSKNVFCSGGNTNLLLQRFRKTETDYEALNRAAKTKSPKILITRAFSEENESTTDRSSVPKPSSSVTTLLIDSSWKSVSRECIEFSAPSKNTTLLTDYTDDSCSDDESPDEDVSPRIKVTRPTNFNVDTSDSDSNPGQPHNSVRSWPFTTKKKNIQFRIGSVVLSERDFSSADDVCTSIIK